MPSLTKQEYETLAAFRYYLRLFLRFSENAAREAGLHQQQYQALLSIKGYPDREVVTIAELAERLQIRHHSAVGLVDRLEAQGLVQRLPGPDRRSVYVALTEQGNVVLEGLALIHHEELHRAGPLLADLLRQVINKTSGHQDQQPAAPESRSER